LSKKKKSRTLTFRLLRKGKSIDDAVSETFSGDSDRALARVPWVPIDGAELVYGQIYSNPPGWADFLAEGVEEPLSRMFTGGAGAILFVPVGGRTLAVNFGHIHIALDDDAFERQFGLKVTLNSVPATNIRTLDLATPDAVTFQKRVQASRDSDIGSFGIDEFRDLARVAGGTPGDFKFGSFVAGKDALSLTSKIEVDDLRDKCKEVLRVFNLTTYKNEFAWVDNLKPVVEKDRIEKLDLQLLKAVQELRSGKSADLHLAPPEIVNYVDGNEIHYNGFGSNGRTFNSLEINDYVSELNRCSFGSKLTNADAISAIKSNHKVAAKPAGEEKFSERWKLYDCFVLEASLTIGMVTSFYVLFAGNWFEVDSSFKSKIDNFYSSLPKVTVIGPTTTANNEEDLIAQIEATRSDLIKLDRTKLNPAGTRYAFLEPCDFFSDQRQFIHLKDGKSSGPISHLWMQGVVSAESFVNDQTFRQKLRTTALTLNRTIGSLLPTAIQRVKRDDYKIVFGVMKTRTASGGLELPFFSKVSLRTAVERLKNMDFEVGLELIEKLPATTSGGKAP